MPQSQQKTDSREFEVAPTGQSPTPASADVRPDGAGVVIRLWGPKPNQREGFTWNSNSVLVYMIADLVGASHGRTAEDSPALMAAHFDSSRQAMVAAKRIQTSLLEFVACRPGESIGAAILIYRPIGSAITDLNEAAVQDALRQTKPGQILFTASVSERLRGLPGVELRTIASTSVMGERQPKLTELVWTTPDRLAILQASIGHEAEIESGDLPALGATVIVHSPSRGKFTGDGLTGGIAAEGLPLEAATGNVAAGKSDNFQKVSPILQDGYIGAPVEGEPNLLTRELDDAEKRSLISRASIIVGLAALVLAGTLIAIFYKPAQVSKLPVPTQQEQSSATGIPDKQPVAIQPSSAQSESSSVKSESAKPSAPKPVVAKQAIARSAAKAPPANPPAADAATGDARAKIRNDIAETTAAYPDESGGVSQKDIPLLLKMAQHDAGAGNYDKARTEYRKILGLQPGNSDAKDGLHKLDIIQQDQR